MAYEKYIKCCYCGTLLEYHHIKSHRKLCYLEPDNIKKICRYVVENLSQLSNFRRTQFYYWAKENKILTSISITTNMNTKNWYHALIQIVIFGYLLGHISFEIVEYLAFFFSDGTFWADAPPSFFEGVAQIDSSHLHENYLYILGAIIERAKRDICYNIGDIDENKEVVDIEDAVIFLFNFCPDVLKNQYQQGALSQDAISLYLYLLSE